MCAQPTNKVDGTTAGPAKVWDGGTGGTCTDVRTGFGGSKPIKGECPIPGVQLPGATGTQTKTK